MEGRFLLMGINYVRNYSTLIDCIYKVANNRGEYLDFVQDISLFLYECTLGIFLHMIGGRNFGITVQRMYFTRRCFR